MASVIATLWPYLSDKARLLVTFKKLTPATCEITSPVSGRYNCIAHAALDCRRKWWPNRYLPQARKHRYWPDSVDSVRTVKAFIETFEIEGFRECADGSLEPGYEKLALYVSPIPTIDNPLPNDAPTHMARQLPCGKWTSKLGQEQDIVHDLPEGLEGDDYGALWKYLKRPRLPIVASS